MLVPQGPLGAVQEETKQNATVVDPARKLLPVIVMAVTGVGVELGPPLVGFRLMTSGTCGL